MAGPISVMASWGLSGGTLSYNNLLPIRLVTAIRAVFRFLPIQHHDLSTTDRTDVSLRIVLVVRNNTVVRFCGPAIGAPQGWQAAVQQAELLAAIIADLEALPQTHGHAAGAV